MLEIADATAHRGAGAIDFRVSYADGLPSFQTVTVAYSTSDGTATAGQEYTGASGTLTIRPGETGGVISVLLLTGTNQEANLDFTLALSDPSEATFAGGEPQVSATGTINYRARIRMRAGQSEVLEGEAAVFELTRDGDPTAELTVQVFSEEPAHPQAIDSDNPSRGSHDVTFPAGSPTATLSVTAHRDQVEESGRDYLEARVVGPAGTSEYRLGAPSKATVEILDSVPDVTVAADRETIDESAIVGDIEDFTFTLTRTGDVSEALEVVVRVDDPEMIRCWDHAFWFGFGGGDNCRNGPTFEQKVTFAEDSSTATLPVEIFDDWRDVPDGAALSVTVLDGAGYRPGDPASDSVTLVDDDETSVLILNVSHDEVTEGQTLTCTVNRYGSISDYEEQFSLDVSGTGRGRDVRASAFVILAPGDERYTATIELPDDDHFGGNWTQTCRIDWVDLYVPLAQERQYFVVLSRRSITVPVRDAGGPRVTIAADQDVITEGKAATFTLTRPGDTSEPLSVNVSVEDPGHFMRGNHTWTAARPPSKVEFEAGSATATLTLPTKDDWRDIPDGTLTATIEPGDRRDYRPGDTSSASVTVEDNDTKPVFELSVGKETYTEGDRVGFTLTRTGDMTHPQTVRLLVGRPGKQRERTYEFRAGTLTQQMVIPTQDNDLDEADLVFVAEFPDRSGDEYYAVRAPYSVTATVEDDDLPRVGVEALADSYREGARTAFRLTREGQTDSTLPVTLRLTESGQSTVYNAEFQLGTRTPVMRESSATYDHHLFLDEGDGDEYDGAVDVVLVERDGYVIDPGRSAASFTVLDTDPTPTLEVSGSRTVSESDGTVEFEVSYSGPASQKEVTVDYATDEGTAAAGDDYTAVAGTLTFGEGETSGVIPVPVSQDSRPEYDESFNLVLSNPRNALLADGAPTVTTVVTIEDDEPRVSIAAVADEVTEGEPAVFTLTRTGGDTTKKLSVSLLIMEETEESFTNRLVPLIETFPENTTTIQVSHETEDDDVDAPALKVLGVVRDLAALYRPSTYLPFRDVALVIVLDDEVSTVTIEAAAPTIEFGTNATFTLTREGDLSDALTVSPDITQEGESDGGNPLPPSASFATGPSTVTFEAGSPTATLRLTTTSSSTYTSDGGDSHTVEVDWGRVNAALPDSDAYITGDPARAAVLIVAHARNYPIVYIDTPSPVTEGEDLVFTLHRTKGEETELTARVRMNTQTFAWLCRAPNCWTFHDVTFEPGSLTATLTVPTEDNEINDGNTRRSVTLALDGRAGVDVPHQGELGYIWKNTRNHPPNTIGWVRDDDIPTVWVTPETGERFEDTEDRSRFTIHRDSYTATETHAFIGYQQLRRWPPPLADTLYSGLRKSESHTRLFNPGESSHEYGFGPKFVGPLGGESRFFLLPHYCGDHDIEDCGTYPQYHLGSPSSGVIKVYNRFAGILIDTDEAEVEEGEDVTFTLTRIGGTPGSNGHPLTVWVEVTQDGEYLEGMPPQTVKFRGWPDTTIEAADRTITLSIPTTDDQVNEPHGAITLRILPPERIDVDEPSSYEAGQDDELAPFETATVRVTDNDPPTMSISDARAGEDDGSMEFTVSVGNPSAREISVEWSTVAETGVDVAIADTDYTAADGTLTFAAGETSRTISVDVLDDNLAENEETFKVVLAAQTMVNAIAGDNEGVGIIEDDDEGRVVTIYPQDPTGEVEEGDTAIFVIQSLGGSGELNVTLKMDLVGDFTIHSPPFTTNVVIPVGETEFLLHVITIDDDEVEANGSVTATVQPGDGYLPGIPDTATLNIRDNDRTLSIADVEAGEGEGEMTFTLRLSAAAEEEVRVEAFTLADGKASPTGDITGTSLGQDYEPNTEWVVFEPGETEQSFTVTVVDDYIDEPPSETFSVRLVHPSSNVWLTGAAATATGTIKDNDDPMEARISRDAKRVDEDRSGAVRFAVELTHEDTIASERDTKLFWTVTTGTATEGADFEKPYGQNRGTLEIPVGHLTGTIEVDLVDDYLLEDRFETFTVALVEARNLQLPDREGQKKVAISIRDDERLRASVTSRADSVIEGSSAVFDVRVSGGKTTSETVLEYTMSGTATAGDDYTAPSGTLTIPAGRDTATLTIVTLTDPVVDPDETLMVTLDSGTSGTRHADVPDRAATVTILDPGTVTASVAPAEAEEGEPLYFDVTLSQVGENDIAVEWETADDSEAPAAATADVDYRKAGGTVTVPKGETSARISVQTIEDTLAAEGDETFRVNLTGARFGFGPLAEQLPLGVSSAIGTIRDDDEAPTRIALAATPGRVREDAAATDVAVTATLDGDNPLASDTAVELTLEEGSATADRDYEAATARLTIPAGALNHTAALTLAPVDDTVAEGDETVSITGTADGLAVVPAEVTITDDDEPPTGVTLTLAPDVVGEGAGALELEVTATLTGEASRPEDTPVTLSVGGASLTLDNDDGTTTTTTAATADDFDAGGATVTIPAGRMSGSATVALTPVDDTIAEGDETAQVSGSAEGLDVAPAGLTIEDNDPAPTGIALSVTPAEVSEGDGETALSVTATLEGGGSRISGTEMSLTVHGVTATAGDDFTASEGVTLTIPAGEMSGSATVALTPVDDVVAEQTEQVAIRGSSAAPGLAVSGVRVALNDNDAEPTMIVLSLDRDTIEENGGAQRLIVTAELQGSSRRTLDTPVRLSVAGETAEASDYSVLPGVLVVKAGEREGTATLVLVPTDDYIDEDDETLEVQGSTSEFRSVSELEVTGSRLTIRDDDTVGVTVTPTELPVGEGRSNSYRVRLNTQPGGDVTVTVDGHSGTELTVSPATLTFTPDSWSIDQAVTVTAAEDDDAVTDDETKLTHTVTGSDYEGVAAADVVVSITEDDTPGVTLTPEDLDVDEGTSSTYTVVLDTEPTADVTVTVGGYSGTDVSLSGATLSNNALVFTSGNWDTAQTVTVTAGSDDDAASDDSVTLTHTAAGGDYADIKETVTVTIIEGDTSVLSVDDAEAAEDGGQVVFTVTISAAAGSDVTVGYATSDGTATAGADYTDTSGTLTFPADSLVAQTVSVPLINDGVDEDEEETFTLTLSNAQGASLAGGGTTLTATGTIGDNDNPTVTANFAQASYTVDEGSSVDVAVTLSADPERQVTIPLTTTGQGGVSNDDYSGVPDNVVFENGDTRTTFTITAAPDDIDDDNETITLQLGDFPNRVTGGATIITTVTIGNDDTAGITTSETTLNIDEGTAGSYTVVLDTEPTADVTVTISGHSGTDITLSDTTLAFTTDTWNTAQTITVTAAEDDDAVDEDDVTLTHTAAGGGYDGVTTGNVTVTIGDDDTAGITTSEAAFDIDEGTAGSYTVVLDTEPTADVTVTVGGYSGTDVSLSGATLSNNALVFTSGNWDTAQTVTVTAGSDDDAASDDSVTLTHTAAGGDYADIKETVTVTIIEGDTSVLSVDDAEAAEDGGQVVFTVTISAAAGSDVTVGYATSDGTATAGADYTDTSGTLTFPADSLVAQTVSVPLINDGVDEDEEETFTLTLSNAQGASLAGGGTTLTATGTIGDNDNPTVTANFAQASYTVDEGSSVDVAVTLSADPERQVTIPLTTTGQGGVSNDDYSGVPDNVVFENGDTRTTFTITAAPDDIDDDNETITLQLGDFPNRVTGGATIITTVTIGNDDTAGITTSETTLNIDEGTAGSYTVVLDTEPTADVTVTISGHSGTDITLSDTTLAFTTDTWNTAQTITVTAAEDDDAVDEDDVTLTHTAAGGGYDGVTTGNVTVTIGDDDTAGITTSEAAFDIDEGTAGSYTVVLDTEPTADVTVTVGGYSGTDVSLSGATLSNNALVFTSGNWDTAQTVTVTAADDDDAASDDSVTLTHTAAGGDYADIKETVTVTIIEGDTSVLSVDDAEAAEDGGQVVFTVTISAAAGSDVTVGYATSDGTATAGADYTDTSGTLTFPADSLVAQTVSVPLINDGVDEDEEETFTLTLSNAQGASLAGGGTTLTATGTIEDNDERGVTIDPTAVTVVAEQSNRYSVVLDTQPTGDVTVAISGQSDTSLTVSPSSLTFRPENWDTAQDVTVAAGSDAGTASVTLTHAVSGGDYNSTKADDVVVAIIGGPQELVIQVGVTASQQDLTVPEGGSNTYSLVLNSAPTGDVTIGVGVPTGNDLSTVQETLTFTTSNWNQSQTVTVSAGEDDDAITDDAVVITHTISGGGYADTAVPGVRVTIIENDTPGVTIMPTQLTVGEGETGEYTVVLDTRPSATVTVAIGGHPGTDLSVSPADSLTFTTADWNQSQTVTVSAAEDNDTNADPAVTLTHTVTGGDYDGQNAAGVKVTVNENDQEGGPTPGDPTPEDPPPEDSVMVSFEKDYHHVAEGAPGGAGVGVVLSAAVESEVTVPVVVLAQSTAGEADYSGVPDAVTFAPGETYTHFQVVPVLEAVEEDDEQVFLGFGPLPEDVGAGHYDQTYVTIFDAALLSFGSSSYVATEGSDGAVVAVRLSKPLPLGQVIPLTAEAGNGATGDDWSGVPSEVHFAAGETVKTFTVTAVDDTVEDDGEKVTLGFGTLRDRLIAVPPARATVTLMNMENGYGYENPPESTPAPCTGTSLTVGTVYAGTIDTAGETDWWKVDLEPYKSYVIYTRGDETGQGTLARPETLQFVGSGSSFLTARRHSTAAGYPASSLAEFGITPYLPGSYCFEVGTRDDEPGTYAVEVVVDESTPNGYQSDVAANTSTRARIHSPVTSYMQTGFLGDSRGPGHDEDWYRVTLDGGVRYQIDVKADTRYEQRHRLTRPKVTGIHDSAGGAIVGTASTGTGTEVSVDFTPRRSGDYYIAVGSNSGDRDGMFLVCARSKAVADEDTCHMGDGPPPGYGPPRAPRNVRVSQGGNQELEVAWTRPSGTSGRRNTTIIGYRVQWKEASDAWDDRSEVTTSARIPGASYTITGLAGGVEYAVRVLAFNFMGVGEPSEEVTGTAGQAQRSSLKSNNTPPTGWPGISGVPRVGEILTATTGGIADEDGLAGAVFDYQWIRHDPASGTDTHIDGAAEPGYTVTSDDAGQGLRVRVSFTDDAGNEESLISHTVAVQAPPLTAEFRNVPERHTGEDAFVVRILFSEGIEIKRRDFRDHALEVTGGSATRAQRVEGRRDLWEISIEPISDDDVSLVLPEGRSCDGAGAICTGDGRWLSNRPMLTVAGPEQQDPDPPDNTEQPQPDPPHDTEQPQPDPPPDNTEQPQPDPPPDNTEQPQPDPPDDTEEPEEPQKPPPPPRNLKAVVNEDGTITLSWDSPDDDSVTGYQIHRIRPKLGDDSFVVYVEDTGSTATSFTDTDTAPGIHIYRVMAINAAGVGKRSNYIAAAVP